MRFSTKFDRKRFSQAYALDHRTGRPIPNLRWGPEYAHTRPNFVKNSYVEQVKRAQRASHFRYPYKPQGLARRIATKLRSKLDKARSAIYGRQKTIGHKRICRCWRSSGCPHC